jgi:hypothetical protein
MLTVVGSVASRLGPREVATACTVGAGVAELRASLEIPVAVNSTTGVAVDSTMIGVGEAASAGWLCAAAGAQADNKTASRLRPGRTCFFLILL